MAKEVVPGRQVRFAASVYNAVDSTPKTSGTIYAPIQVELAGDADDGRFWDTDSGGSWKVFGSVVSHPTMTYVGGSFWEYVLPATAVPAAKDGATVKQLDATDNLAVPGSQTTLPQGLETVLVRREILSRNGFLSLK